jgi:hypothetical protein
VMAPEVCDVSDGRHPFDCDVCRRIAAAYEPRDAERAARAAAAPQLKAEHDRAKAKLTASQKWASLAREDVRGMNYLERRGLDAAALADHVRYDHRGNPTLAVRNPAGLVVNIARRIIDPTWDGPKVLGLKDAPTEGTLIGFYRQIREGCTVVIGEGVADALTAVLAFPAAVVLFAHGGGNVPKVMAAVLPYLRANPETRALLVTHNDEVKRREVQGKIVEFTPGQAMRDQCLELARAAGESVAERVMPVALPTKDLNDAWCQGWRWSPPEL